MNLFKSWALFVFGGLFVSAVGCASPYWTANDTRPLTVDRDAVLGPRSATEEMLDRSPRIDCAEQIFGSGTMPMCR